MKLSYRFFKGFVIFPILFFVSFTTVHSATVGKWRRYVVSAPNSTYTGNAFELKIDATFTHTASGSVINLPGYYAGNDIWKVGFMPTKPGEWIYETSSSDPELDGIAGSITCVESGLPGILKTDPNHPRKWKFTDGSYAVPIGVFVQLMQSDATTVQFEGMADFLKNNNLQLINFRLCEQDICFSDVANLEMDLARWDRLEERLQILAERGLGVDIMLYTDDAGKPSYSARSTAEEFLVRYMIARLASFPVVNFNTGIDIWEYRDSSWHDWYGNLIRSLDPYGHPVSSRGAVGSDNSFMSAGVQTYNSNGARNSQISRLIGAFNAASVPSSNNDNWGEQRTGINGHTPEDIRRAGWKATVAGGVGFHVRDNKNNDCANGVISNCDTPFSVTGIQNDLDSEQWLKLVNPFVQTKLGETFGEMVPDSLLVSNGYALADPDRTKILYFLMGNNDTWDIGNGGAGTIKLSGLTGSYKATWFDTRTGTEIDLGYLDGGNDHVIEPPSTDDWVLLLNKTTNQDSTPPEAPGGLRATPVSESSIDLAWQSASDPDSGVSTYKVYRDGILIGQSASTVYSDTGLKVATSYTYEVSGVNGAGLESNKSTSVSTTIPGDTTPPTIVTVSASGDSTQVSLIYSEPVDEITATDTANYTINYGIAVNGASLNADLKTVTLTTDSHTENLVYILTVNNVKDLAISANVIASNTQVNYSFVAQSKISNLTVASGREYEVVSNGLQIGASVYIDRIYTYNSVPQWLKGSTYIITANDDKGSSGDSFLSFDVNQDVTVYVAHDHRTGTKPSWMGTFTNTGDNLVTTDTTLDIYAKDFPAGKITLGGNEGAASLYSVIIFGQGSGPPVDQTAPSAPTGLEIISEN